MSELLGKSLLVSNGWHKNTLAGNSQRLADLLLRLMQGTDADTDRILRAVQMLNHSLGIL
jgi:hypothetical protein